MSDNSTSTTHVLPKRLLEELDEPAEELNYTNRSEFVREVLHDTTEPILTPGAQKGVSHIRSTSVATKLDLAGESTKG